MEGNQGQREVTVSLHPTVVWRGKGSVSTGAADLGTTSQSLLVVDFLNISVLWLLVCLSLIKLWGLHGGPVSNSIVNATMDFDFTPLLLFL